MPNHVKNIFIFDRPLDKEKGNTKLPVPDIDTAGIALAVMLVEQVDGVMDLLEYTAGKEAVEKTWELWHEQGFDSPQKETVVLGALEKLMAEEVEVATPPTNMDKDGFLQGVMDSLQSDFSNKVIYLKWNHHVHYMPAPMGVLVNGFCYSCSYNHFAEKHGFSTIDFPVGYDWALSKLGTKWGVYNTLIINKEEDEGVLAFDTAWSPMCETAIVKFIKWCEEYFEAKFCEHHYSEAGNGFAGSGVLVDGEYVETDSVDYSMVWVVWHEEDEKEAIANGYQKSIESDEYSVFTPDGVEPAQAIEVLTSYGLPLGG